MNSRVKMVHGQADWGTVCRPYQDRSASVNVTLYQHEITCPRCVALISRRIVALQAKGITDRHELARWSGLKVL